MKRRTAPFSEELTERLDVTNVIEQVAACIEEQFSPSANIAQRAHSLHRRLIEKRFQVAILGQFKRGKSTFLNALLGEALLPSGVIPLTAIPTFISWGSEPCVRVSYLGNRPPVQIGAATPDDIRNTLFTFVAEEANTENRLNVARVDLIYSAPILKDGVSFIDTPGIGSTNAHNTDMALSVLPECDAALFIVSADPPITQLELDYLGAIRSKVARLIFVLNKIDYLEENDVHTAQDFLRSTVERLPDQIADLAIFCVSARAGLRAKKNADKGALEESGMAEVEQYLLDFLHREKLSLLEIAGIQKASDLIAEFQADISLRLRALELPIEDLESRSRVLQRALDDLMSQAHSLRDLVSGDRRRTIEKLEEYADEIRHEANVRLKRILEEHTIDDFERIDKEASQALAEAIPAIFDEYLQVVLEKIAATTEAALSQHLRRIDELINHVRRTAADLFDVPYAAAAGSEPLKFLQEPYWVTQQSLGTLTIASQGVVDRVLPVVVRRTRRMARLEASVNELVLRNVENLRWSLLQGVENTFRRFTDVLEARLEEASNSTHGAVHNAREFRATAADRASAELSSLRRTLARLVALQSELIEVRHGNHGQ